MNVYDSGRMEELLAPEGYVQGTSPDEADLIILNTCHIREKAAEKVYSELGRLRPLKEAKRRAGGRMVVAVGGCVAQAEGVEIMRRAPVVDIVFGPQTYHRLPALVSKVLDGEGRAVLDTDFPTESKFDFLPKGLDGLSAKDSGTGNPAAFLTVQEGCDKFCTFCVVPYTRGAEYSRPVEEVEAEARRLVAGGALEITLLGQNVNAYHGGDRSGTPIGLGRLLERLARINGIQRLRYATSHPVDMDDELLAAHRDLPQMMPFLHLPVQSGSDKVLGLMNRRHRADDYLRTAARAREARPDLALSSDFIVGFPGESEADFAETLRLVSEVEFAQAYSFKYSARPGTPAAALDGQVEEAEKSDRLLRLQNLLNEQQQVFNEACVGRVMEVLFERPGRRAGQLVGRSPYMQAVHADAGDDCLSRVVGVEIESGQANSLAGRLVDTAPGQLSRRGAAA